MLLWINKTWKHAIDRCIYTMMGIILLVNFTECSPFSASGCYSRHLCWQFNHEGWIHGIQLQQCWRKQTNQFIKKTKICLNLLKICLTITKICSNWIKIFQNDEEFLRHLSKKQTVQHKSVSSTTLVDEFTMPNHMNIEENKQNCPNKINLTINI